MFFRTTNLLIRAGSKTLDHQAKRVGPTPVARWMYGRRKTYQSRLKDMGPYWNAVWCAVKSGNRQKRMSKSHDKMRDRFIWRPIERGYQRLYVAELQLPKKRSHFESRPRLRAKNWEVGQRAMWANGYWFTGKDRFGNGPYYPVGYNGDYRVF
eukprot:PhF_6_TR4779/c0_g1_i2/m.6594